MNFEQSPFERETEEIREAFRKGFNARDAEIERLKLVLADFEDADKFKNSKLKEQFEEIARLKALITELCDSVRRDEKDAEIERLKAEVESGRVELREQWERMHTENLACKNLMSEKDAEIERLRKENNILSISLESAVSTIERLCDAVERQHGLKWSAKDLALIQRAREATK